MAVIEYFIGQCCQTKDSIDGIIAFNIEHILYSATLTVAVSLRNFKALQPVAASLLREEEHRLMHGCRINELCKVLFAMTGTL